MLSLFLYVSDSQNGFCHALEIGMVTSILSYKLSKKF